MSCSGALTTSPELCIPLLYQTGRLDLQAYKVETATDREWRSRETEEVVHVESLLPRFMDNLRAEPTRLRIQHAVTEILGGSHRDDGRGKVLTEDEWRQATKEAGTDPEPPLPDKEPGSTLTELRKAKEAMSQFGNQSKL